MSTIHAIADCLGYTLIALALVLACISIDAGMGWAIRKYRNNK